MNKSTIFSLIIVITIGSFLYQGMYYDPKIIKSPMIGKTFPIFSLKDLFSDNIYTNQTSFDRITIVNIWASWCLECDREHSYLIELSKNNDFDLIGINYKDEPSDAMNWLSMRGNPYKIIISDLNGDLSMNLGVYGVPETYIVNENQTIIYKHIGPLTKTIIKNEMEPLLRKKE